MGLALMAVQVLATVLLIWYAANRFHAYNLQHTVSEIARMMPFLTHRYGDLSASGVSDRELDRVVKDDADHTAVRITLIRPDGTVIADSERDPATMDNHSHRPEVASAIAGNPVADLRESVTTREETSYLAESIVREGKPVLIVRGALPLSAVSAEPARVMRVVAFAALVSLLLTFLLIYLVSRRMTGSIQRLAEGASRFAAGDLTHRVSMPESRELATLATALNNMAARLNDQIDLLQTQRSEQQAIHQSMTNGLIALDPDQRVISLNRAAENLLGVEGAEARGRLVQEVLREPELHRFVAEAMAASDAAGDSASAPQSVAEMQLRRSGGPRIQAVSQPLRNSREQAAGLLILMTDVTELRRLETIRSDFAANVSHELRTPITNIKGYVETMLDVGVADQSRTRKFLEVISRNTQRLASIIEDLLALARLEQPDTRASLEKETVPAERALEAALGQLESEIDSRRIRIVTRVPPGLRAIANLQLLEQALGNLISNAVKYSPPGTTVTITCEPSDDGGVAFAVTDEGPGISEEHLPRIFERFYRVDRARSREVGGTGLGLSIVKHIALVHRGSVTVESRVGHGSTFRLTLPGA
jgi:two-component system phosphate regulon sensor histidine kinase PhoR